MVSAGRVLRCAATGSGRVGFFAGTEELKNWASQLYSFPQDLHSVLEWVCGAEGASDRPGGYFRMRVATVGSSGHSAIHFRFNNKAPLPDSEISEFSIRCDPAAIHRLGGLFRQFAQLDDDVMQWTPNATPVPGSPEG